MTGEHGPEPPADRSWEPEIEELRRRLELAHAMGGPENVARQHKAGRLTVRERIERLLDPGSFHETGALAGFRPANFVLGIGRLDPRDTRPLLTDWVTLACELEATRLGPKQRGARP
jgi:acetyl-CoA carboxylase carboxyltransferase component